MARKVNCIFLFPAELTGLDYDTCRLFGVCYEARGIVDRCVGRTRHTKASRQALAEAIEIVRARREKNSPLTPQSEI